MSNKKPKQRKYNSRITRLEQQVDDLKDKWLQVQHMAVWDTPNGEVTSVADLLERPNRD